MLEKIKKSLRISNSFYDDEITDLIEAAKCEMTICGIKKIEDTDPLIIRCITLYSKSEFGLNNADADKYRRSYESLKNHLSMCEDYTNVL